MRSSNLIRLLPLRVPATLAHHSPLGRVALIAAVALAPLRLLLRNVNVILFILLAGERGERGLDAVELDALLGQRGGRAAGAAGCSKAHVARRVAARVVDKLDGAVLAKEILERLARDRLAGIDVFNLDNSVLLGERHSDGSSSGGGRRGIAVVRLGGALGLALLIFVLLLLAELGPTKQE